MRDALTLLAQGGQLRVQLLADESDPEGILPLEQAPALRLPPPLFDEIPIEPGDQCDLDEIEQELSGTYYMGHRFRYAEAEALLRELAPGAVIRVMRFDPSVLYADVAPR